MGRGDADTEEYAATEEYEEDTEEDVKEYSTRMEYETQKVVSLASGRHEQASVSLGGAGASSRGMKRSNSEVTVNEDVDVRCVPPAHADPKRSKQGCASSDEEIVHGITEPACAAACLHDLPQQLAFPSDWPEGEYLSAPIFPSFSTYCRPCIRE